jgi:hypothetical protein
LLKNYLSQSAYNSLALEKLRRKAQQNTAKQAPDKWDEWLFTLFPNLFYLPFVDRHTQFWQHIEAIEPGTKPPAFFAIWGRGGGKSTNAEAAAVRLGAKGSRKFCLYTRSTQDKANESVMNIAAMLESKGVSQYYPQLSSRKLGKYGNSKGWRVNMIRCANGFNVAALGYDAAVRGIKLEEYRPDVIFIDDIDDKTDTLETITKKINTLTRDILPSGSSDVAVIGIQNLVNYSGIFTQISKGQADFLRNRIVSGPYPAVDNLEYEMGDSGQWQITGGTPTWEGQDLVTCEAQMNEWGLSAFISEAQLTITRKEGRVYHAFPGPGPDAKSLDLSQVTAFYHSHDFGAVNQVWGLFAKIEDRFFMLHEQKLPEGTTAARAALIKAKLFEVLKPFIDQNLMDLQGKVPEEKLMEQARKMAWDSKVLAGMGGAKSEDQQRLDYSREGVIIRLPFVVDIESQIDLANRMFEGGKLVICSNCVQTVDQLENCVRDEKEGIQDKSIFHFADCIRYFAPISRRGRLIG